MKILTLKRVVGLAAIGGLAYAHKRRGGEWTVDSIKDSLRDLWASANSRLAPLKDELRDTLDRAGRASDTATRSGMSAEPRSYSYDRRDNDNNRH